jgi:hypothetical protein
MGSPRHTVQEDWLARLPEERRAIFEAISREWESAYAMLSVTLNDAMAERAGGRLVQARRQSAMAGQLASRLVERVTTPLDVLRRRGRAGGSLPVVEALRPGHFRSERAQQSAAWSYLAYRLPLGRRWRFVLKLAALGRMLERAGAEFSEVAQEIAEGTSVNPEASWETLELLHDDLNTAMREAVVVLKSFLGSACARGFAAFCDQLARPRQRIEAGLSGASP